jgi:hypothetical protein
MEEHQRERLDLAFELEDHLYETHEQLASLRSDLGRTRRQLELVDIEKNQIVEAKTQIEADLELLAQGIPGC